jgi:hypothetical protein
MTESSVAQLHRTLVEAIRRTRPGALDRPVTVAEIYQDLVPYRTARDVGFEMNADYEYALLRLLAGEGDFARIEPREVRDKLRMELESANPDVGLFRHYAACDVWVNIGDAEVSPEDELTLVLDQLASWEEEFVGPSAAMAAAPQPASPLPTGAEASDEEIADVFEAEEEQPAPAQTRRRFEIATGSAETSEEPTPEGEPTVGSCTFCGGELPGSRMVNFCPFCGSDQSQQPCPTCGEMLEPLWRFCISCGTRVRPLGDHVN